MSAPEFQSREIKFYDAPAFTKRDPMQFIFDTKLVSILRQEAAATRKLLYNIERLAAHRGNIGRDLRAIYHKELAALGVVEAQLKDMGK